MSNLFFKDFELFIQSNNIQYIRDNNVFYFNDNRYSICLVCSETQISKISHNLYLYQDVWYRENNVIKQRILANLGQFKSVFARNCYVLSGRKNEKISEEIKLFLEKYHTYSDAKSRYKYALYYDEKIVAVASFSAGREMPRDKNNTLKYLPKTLNPNLKDCVLDDYKKYENLIIMFQSFEWVRYASLPNIRVIGGMGKLLKAFINDILEEYPDDNYFEIMSYSDNEWGRGDVYKKLNFKHIDNRKPVEYYVNRSNNKRIDVKHFNGEAVGNFYKIKNLGSAKFLLQFIRTPHCSSPYSFLD